VKRLLRILRSTVALLSLLLFLITSGSCFRSHFVSDEFSISRLDHPYGGTYWRYHQVDIGKGAIAFSRGIESARAFSKRPFHRTRAAQYPDVGWVQKTYFGIAVRRYVFYDLSLFSTRPTYEGHQVVVPFAWVFLLIALIGSPFWFLWYRARRRPKLGLCPTCGYDLRATPNLCPECGTDGRGRQTTEDAANTPYCASNVRTDTSSSMSSQ
jgi:hypothetical protein